MAPILERLVSDELFHSYYRTKGDGMSNTFAKGKQRYMLRFLLFYPLKYCFRNNIHICNFPHII